MFLLYAAKQDLLLDSQNDVDIRTIIPMSVMVDSGGLLIEFDRMSELLAMSDKKKKEKQLKRRRHKKRIRLALIPC